MKYILTVLLVMFASPLLAQTGIFYNDEYVGEGVTVFEHENLHGDLVRTAYLFTYGAEVCTPVITDQIIKVKLVATATAECPDDKDTKTPLCDPVTVTEKVTKRVPTQSISTTCHMNGQRWFVGSDVVDDNGDTVGTMFVASGIDFPKCVPSDEPFEEDVLICGEVTKVGTYVIRPSETGYALWISSDDKEDPAFNRRYDLNTNLIAETGPK